MLHPNENIKVVQHLLLVNKPQKLAATPGHYDPHLRFNIKKFPKVLILVFLLRVARNSPPAEGAPLRSTLSLVIIHCNSRQIHQSNKERKT